MPKVLLKGLDTEFDVNVGEVIYDALDDRGTQLPHGCLSGSCGACRIEILEGSENLYEATFIENNTVDAIKKEQHLEAKEVRLACRAKVRGNVVIKIIS